VTRDTSTPIPKQRDTLIPCNTIQQRIHRNPSVIEHVCEQVSVSVFINDAWTDVNINVSQYFLPDYHNFLKEITERVDIDNLFVICPVYTHKNTYELEDVQLSGITGSAKERERDVQCTFHREVREETGGLTLTKEHYRKIVSRVSSQSLRTTHYYGLLLNEDTPRCESSSRLLVDHGRDNKNLKIGAYVMSSEAHLKHVINESFIEHECTNGITIYPSVVSLRQIINWIDRYKPPPPQRRW
jgi:hypothetical protein